MHAQITSMLPHFHRHLYIACIQTSICVHVVICAKKLTKPFLDSINTPISLIHPDPELTKKESQLVWSCGVESHVVRIGYVWSGFSYNVWLILCQQIYPSVNFTTLHGQDVYWIYICKIYICKIYLSFMLIFWGLRAC